MPEYLINAPPSGRGWGYALQQAVNALSQPSLSDPNILTFPAGRLDWIVPSEPGTTSALYGPVKKVSIPNTKLPLMLKGQPTSRVTCPYCGRPNMWVPDNGWNTTLVQAVEGGGDIDGAPGWIDIAGISDTDPLWPEKEQRTLRTTDLKFEGYRSLHPTSISMTSALGIGSFLAGGLYNFRVDHSAFEHVCHGAVSLYSRNYRGLIDHSRIYNIYGHDGIMSYATNNVGYGIHVSGDWTPYSIPFAPLPSLLGKFDGPQTLYVEDCLLSKWRHCISGHHGGYFVLRHSSIDGDEGNHSLDMHGLRETEAGRNAARGAEIYENRFINCTGLNGDRQLFQWYGGSVQWFNNFIDDSYEGFYFYDEVCYDGATACDPTATEQYKAKHTYVWSSPSGATIIYGPELPTATTRYCKVDWARQAGLYTDPNYPNLNPAWSIANGGAAGIPGGYKPYIYPHPLTYEPGQVYPLNVDANIIANFILNKIG